MKNFIFSVSLDELKIINDALMQMPYYQAAPVINSINKQLAEKMDNQQQAKEQSLDSVSNLVQEEQASKEKK